MAQDTTASGASLASSSPYIGGPWQDWLLLILSPVLACVVGVGVVRALAAYTQGGREPLYSFLEFYALTGLTANSHFVLSLYRSHLNRDIFRRTPLRFTLMPVLLLLCVQVSDLCFAVVLFINIWWDTWHSSSQTFGLGRIYDQRLGNDPEAGRTLDLILNWLLYTGPIIAGAILNQDISNSVGGFGGRYASWGGYLSGLLHRVLEPAAIVIGPIGLLFLAYYVLSYRRLIQQGYRYSGLKLALFASTFAAAIFSWGFNGWGAAILSMNLFHTVQYFAVVWFAEKRNIRSLYRMPSGNWALAPYLASGLLYGGLFLLPFGSKLWVMKLGIVVATLHFWYDGFIWSVRKKQIDF